jgi:hypothetical protein
MARVVPAGDIIAGLGETVTFHAARIIFNPDEVTQPQNAFLEANTPDKLLGITPLPALGFFSKDSDRATKWDTASIVNGVLHAAGQMRTNFPQIVELTVRLVKQYRAILASPGPLFTRNVELSSGRDDEFATESRTAPTNRIRVPVLRALRVFNYLLDSLVQVIDPQLLRSVDEHLADDVATGRQLYETMRTFFAVTGAPRENALAFIDVSATGVQLEDGSTVSGYQGGTRWTTLMDRVRVLKLLDVFGHTYALLTRSTTGLRSLRAGAGGEPRPFPLFMTSATVDEEIDSRMDGSLRQQIEELSRTTSSFITEDRREEIDAAIGNFQESLEQVEDEADSSLRRSQMNQARATFQAKADTFAGAPSSSSPFRASVEDLYGDSPRSVASSPVRPQRASVLDPVEFKQDGSADVTVTSRGSPPRPPTRPPIFPSGSPFLGTPILRVENDQSADASSFMSLGELSRMNLSVNQSGDVSSADGTMSSALSGDVTTVSEASAEASLVPPATLLDVAFKEEAKARFYDSVLTTQPVWWATLVDSGLRDYDAARIDALEERIRGSARIGDMPDVDANTVPAEVFSLDTFRKDGDTVPPLPVEVERPVSNALSLQASFRGDDNIYLGSAGVLAQSRARAFPFGENASTVGFTVSGGDVGGEDTKSVYIVAEQDSDLTGLLAFYRAGRSSGESPQFQAAYAVRQEGGNDGPTTLTFDVGVEYLVDFGAIFGNGNDESSEARLDGTIPHPNNPQKSVLDVEGQLQTLIREAYAMDSQVGRHAANMLSLALFRLDNRNDLERLTDVDAARGDDGGEGSSSGGTNSADPDDDGGEGSSSGGTNSSTRITYGGMGKTGDVASSLIRAVAEFDEALEVGAEGIAGWFGSTGLLLDQYLETEPGTLADRVVARLDTIVKLHLLHLGGRKKATFKSVGIPAIVLQTEESSDGDEFNEVLEKGKTAALLEGLYVRAAVQGSDNIRGGMVLVIAAIRAGTVFAAEDKSLLAKIYKDMKTEGRGKRVMKDVLQMFAPKGRSLRKIHPVLPAPSVFMRTEDLHKADRIQVTAHAVSSLVSVVRTMIQEAYKKTKPRAAKLSKLSLVTFGILFGEDVVGADGTVREDLSVEETEDIRGLHEVFVDANARVEAGKIMVPLRFVAGEDGGPPVSETPLAHAMVLALARPLAATEPFEDGSLLVDAFVRSSLLMQGARILSIVSKNRFVTSRRRPKAKPNAGIAFFMTPSEMDQQVSAELKTKDLRQRWSVQADVAEWGAENQESIGGSIGVMENRPGDLFTNKDLVLSPEMLRERLEFNSTPLAANQQGSSKKTAVADLNAFYSDVLISPASVIVRGRSGLVGRGLQLLGL